MRDSVTHNVGHMLVRKLVNNLPPAPLRPHKLSPAQDPEMLTDEWLSDIESVDELVHTIIVVREQLDHRKPDRGRERPEELARRLIAPQGWMGYRQALLTVDFPRHGSSDLCRYAT
jgi:hypothetical protein